MDNVYLLIFYSVVAILVLIAFFLLLYIRNQNMIWQQRRLFQETEIKQQKDLLNAVIASQEIERKRIGEDLHDEVGGTLSAIKLMLNAAIRKYSETEKQAIIPAKQLIDQLIIDVRNVSHDLSPPGLAMFGLINSIEGFVSLIKETGEVEIEVVNNIETNEKLLSESEELALYRVITQLIANTLKHASATKIELNFNHIGDELLITYQDNGIGFDLTVVNEKKGMGMQNIISRLQMIDAKHELLTAVNEGFKMNISCKIN